MCFQTRRVVVSPRTRNRTQVLRKARSALGVTLSSPPRQTWGDGSCYHCTYWTERHWEVHGAREWWWVELVSDSGFPDFAARLPAQRDPPLPWESSETVSSTPSWNSLITKLEGRFPASCVSLPLVVGLWTVHAVFPSNCLATVSEVHLMVGDPEMHRVWCAFG